MCLSPSTKHVYIMPQMCLLSEVCVLPAVCSFLYVLKVLLIVIMNQGEEFLMICNPVESIRWLK